MKRLNFRQIAWRIAQDIADGMIVNLGLGLPVLVSDYIPANRDVFLQSENGIIGVGPLASPGDADPDLVDAGSRRVSLRPGAAIVDSAASFAMIRGGHLDVTVLGAFEVAENGDLANWDMGDPSRPPLVGGAMDLAASSRATWVMIEHTTKTGAHRLVELCSLPLTAPRCVTRVYTDLAVIAVNDGFTVLEMADGVTCDELQRLSGAPLVFAPGMRSLITPDLPDGR